MTRLRSLWPAAVQRASAVEAVDQPSDLVARLTKARAALVSLDLVRELSALGIGLESAETGVMAATHFIVYEREADGIVRQAVKDLPAVDSLVLICLCKNDVQIDPPSPGQALFVASPTNALGVTVAADDMAAAVALFVCLAVLPKGRGLVQGAATGVQALGAAGIVGPAGDWLRPVAARIAARLLDRQADVSPAADQQQPLFPTPARTLVDAMKAGPLLAQVFDPATIEAPRSEALPLNVGLEGGEIAIALREDAFILNLAEGDEAGWVSRIRGFERSLVGVGVPAWTARVRLAGERVATALPERVEQHLRPLLNAEPHGPWWTGYVGGLLRDEAGIPVNPQARAADGVGSALRTLAGRVRALPNPVALALRTALVAAPAAVFVFPVVAGLYTDARRLWLPWLVVAALALGAAAISVGWLARNRARRLRARAAAVKAVGDAAATLVAHEAAAALESVRHRLRQEVAKWSKDATACRDQLRERATAMRESPEADPATLQPLMPTGEAPALASRLALDPAPWLDAAVRAGVVGCGTASDKALLDWCLHATRDKVAGELDTADAWRGVRVEDLDQLAAPLAATPGRGESRWLFAPSGRSPDAAGGGDVVAIDIPVCAVVRIAPVQGTTAG